MTMEELEAKYGPEIARAFARVIEDLRANVDFGAVEDAIRSGAVEAALDAMHIEAAAYNDLLDAIEAAYREGGAQTMAGLPSVNPEGVALVFRFDARNLVAEGWLRAYAARRVVEIVEDQREALRIALAAGMEKGQNPRTAALDIVGRIDRATGKRTGGIVGLTSKQAQYVVNARAELESLDSGYFDRAARDKRFDGAIRKAIREGRPVPAETLRKAIIAYERRLLKIRGDTIGRTEAMTALHKAQDDAISQAVESGQIPAAAVSRIWEATGDSRVRETHRKMDGQKQPWGRPFISPSGAVLRFPGDPNAPAREIINCRCWLRVKVDWLSLIED
jgi:hypothetical protein